MTYPRRPATHLTARDLAEAGRPWTVTPNGRAARPVPPTRRYEMLWLQEDDTVAELSRVAPATPPFESAFAAFARGTLVATELGQVAVEDLLPGDMVLTRTGAKPVRWIGRITLPPANLKQDSGPDIYRIAAESFGPTTPSPDLVLCSGARILHRVARLAKLRTGPDLLVPIGDFADGVSVLEISPMSAVTAYHIALDQHSVIEANGIAVETYHPGRDVPDELNGDLLRVYLSMFPYLEDLPDFGPLALPQLGLEAIDRLAYTA